MYAVKRTDLFPAIQALMSRIEAEWAKGSPVVIQAGQRGGKSTMARCFLYELPRVRKAIVIAATIEHARTNVYAPGVHYASNKVDVEDLVFKGLLDAETLVVIDEVFWIGPHAEALFDAFAKVTPYVLAVSSKGKNRWRNRKRIWRFATWDLNPTITRKVLAPHYRDDPAAARRDFGKLPA